MEYSVDFHRDMIDNKNRYVSNATYGVSYSTGKREPMRLSREAVIRQKELTSGFTYTAYTSYHYMDEVPREQRAEYASTLTLSTDNDILRMAFNPVIQGLPGADLAGIKAIFGVLDLDSFC